MSGKTCQKQNHNQDYLYLNWTDDKQNFLQCAKCITEDEGPSFKKILISDILNDKYKLEQINNWPPLGNKKLTEFAHYICKKIQENPGVENLMNHLIQNQIDDYFDQQTEEICQKLNSLKKKVKIQFQNTIEEFLEKNREVGEPNIEQILSDFKIEDFRQKIEEFLNNKVDLDQFFQFQQEYNQNLQNNQHKKIQKYFNKQQNIYQEFDRLKGDMKVCVDNFNKLDFNVQQQINMKFFTSQNCKWFSTNSINISQDFKKIIYSAEYQNNNKEIESEKLEQKNKYQIKLRVDTKKKMCNQILSIGIKNQQNQNAVNVYIFNQNENISGSGNGISCGQYLNLCDVFRDKETVLNVIIDFKNKQFKFFDDEDKIKVIYTLQNINDPIFFMNYQQNKPVQNIIYIDQVKIF